MGEGEDGTDWQSSIEYALPWVMAVSGKLLYNPGSSTQCSAMTWRGGMGWQEGGRFKKDGMYVYIWLIHVAV